MGWNDDQAVNAEPGTPLGAHDPRQIGPYVVLRRLGGGGMGTVYLARRQDSTWRVALKIIQTALLENEPQLRDRFAREIAHAQRVDGRYTARILDADLRSDQPWMATEYVPGPTLDAKVARSGPLPLPALLELASGVSEALSAIHAAGLIHRDLKPGNVILAVDGPRVIDFGIAHGAETTRLTGTGSTIGTLAYMSPEQLGGQSLGPASDVFSLGGVLCHASTGHVPFPAEHYGAVIHAVLTGEPYLADVADPWMRELIAACLAKNPQDRPTPDQVRHTCAARIAELTDVLAQPATEPMPAPAPTAFAGLPPAPPPGQVPQGQVPQGQVPQGQVPQGQVPPPAPAPDPAGGRSRNTRWLLVGLGVVLPWLLVLGYLGTHFFLSSSGTVTDRILVGHTNYIGDVAWSSDGETVATSSTDGTVRLWDPVTGYTRTTLLTESGSIYGVALSSDDKTAATAGSDNTVRLWDTTSGKQVRALTGHTSSVYAVAFSPDGKTLASGSGDNSVRLWDTGSGRLLHTLTDHTASVYSLAFSPDGKTLATGSSDNTVRLWDTDSGQDLRTVAKDLGSVYALAFSRDGKTIATGSSRNDVGLWDPATGQNLKTLTGHTNTVYGVAFSPDGKTVASCSGDNTVRLWNLATGETVRALAGHADGVNGLAYSPDGKALTTVSDDKTARIWAL